MRPFAIPMRTRFRGVTERAGVLIEGPQGWGEFSPFPDYPAKECARWAAAAKEAANVAWPPALRERVPINAIVPAVGPDRAHAIVLASGCRTAKVKVAEPGETLHDDLARCEAVRDALGPSGRMRIDANAAWDVDTAAKALSELERFDLEYAEQPVATLEEMARLRGRVDVALAADESVRTAADPLRIAGLGAADVVVLKVQPLGGVRAALRVAEAAASEAALSFVVSSAVETSVGLAAGLALAAALPELPYACGLGTLALLDGDVVADPLTPTGGDLVVRRPAVDPDRLSRWASGPDVAAALRRRYEEAART